MTTQLPKFVIISSGENNFYDDSDFYHMVVDTTEKRLFKFIHSSTRFGGEARITDQDGNICEVAIQDLPSDLKNLACSMASTSAMQQAEALLMQCHDFAIGDRVVVSYEKARKHKNLEFTVAEISEFTSRYGRTETTYLHANDGIKVNGTNCSMVKPSNERIAKIADRILSGVKVKL